MARIKIEDLPVGEDLTPEQEEQIFGAGFRTYRPMFEALEARELMTAGLQRPVIPPSDGHVRTLRNDHQPIVDFSKSHLVEADSRQVYRTAEKFLKDTIIGSGPADGRFSNRWTLSNRVEQSKVVVVGDQIKLTFNVWYGAQGAPCQVQLNFQGKIAGGVQAYELVGAGLHNWKGVGAIGSQFEEVAKDNFKSKVGKIECFRFDQDRVGRDLAGRVASICHDMYFFRNDKLSFDGCQARDGGLTVFVKLPDSRLQLDFNYIGQQGQRDGFQLHNVERWNWWGSNGWNRVDLDPNIANALKGVATTDSFRQMLDGKRFADEHLKTIVDKASGFRGQTADGWRNGNVSATVERVEKTDEGIKVIFKLHVNMQYKHDTGVKPDVVSFVGVSLKFDGVSNGLSRYTCTGVDHNFNVDWRGQPRKADYNYENVFGLSDAALKQEFAKYSYTQASPDYVVQQPK
jgi:hypothetical protein